MHLARADAELGALARSRRPQRGEKSCDLGIVMLAAPAPTVRQHPAAESQHFDAMTEVEQRVRQRRRHPHRGARLRAVVHGHRRAGIDEKAPVGHRLRLEAAHDRTAEARRLAPVDVADLVAGDVIAMIEVLDADAGPARDRARPRRARLTVDQQLRGHARERLQLRLARQRRPDQSRARHPSITEASAVSASMPSSSLSRRRRTR